VGISLIHSCASLIRLACQIFHFWQSDCILSEVVAGAPCSGRPCSPIPVQSLRRLRASRNITTCSSSTQDSPVPQLDFSLSGSAINRDLPPGFPRQDSTELCILEAFPVQGMLQPVLFFLSLSLFLASACAWLEKIRERRKGQNVTSRHSFFSATISSNLVSFRETN
jgi:hypothetical protein